MNLKVENPNNLPTLSITSLIPSQGELKDLSKENYNKLKASFEKHGFIFPVSVWQDKDGKNYLIDGHQRKRVIESEYGDADVPTIKIPAKNINEAAEILLKVTSQYGTITQEGLDSFIAKYELPEAEIYEATHYDAISYLQQDKDEVEEDEAPEVSDEPPVSELGKIYQLGRHRVMCGDSTDSINISRLMGGFKADMVFTDPPYGMDLDTDFTDMKGISGGNKYRKVEGDDKDYDPSHIFEVFGYCKEIFLWGADYYAERVPDRLKGSWFVWDKTDSGVSPNTDYEKMFGSNFELCWSRVKHKRAIVGALWKGIFGLSSEDTKNRQHPTQKPTKLCGWFIDHFSKPQNVIVDLFLGSGSTLIACEQTDRTCYGLEIDPKYVDVIRKRYAKFTNDNELPENWEDLTPPVV